MRYFAFLSCLIFSSIWSDVDAFLSPSNRPTPQLSTPWTHVGRPTSQLEQLKFSSASLGWERRVPLSEKLQKGLRRMARAVRQNEVTQWRLAFGSFFGSLFLFRHAIDAKLVILWDYLLHSSALFPRIFRTDSWEWCWAISCFAMYIHAFGWADKRVRAADQRGVVHPWKKFRLQDRYETDRRRRMLYKRQTEGHLSDDNSVVEDEASALLPVQHSPWNWKAWLQEFNVYAVPLLIWDIVAPRRHRRIGGFGAPTTLGILGGVVGGLVLYDFLFFLGHVAMHKIPFFHRTVHAKHHEISEVRACEIVRLSVVEQVLEVGFSIVALNLLSVHPVARTIYNAIITFLLTELHCGFDFPWTPQNVVPFGLATGSRRHHYHHRNGKHYYQKFFHHVDYIFGFFQKNDGSLQGDSVQAKPYIPSQWQQA